MPILSAGTVWIPVAISVKAFHRMCFKHQLWLQKAADPAADVAALAAEARAVHLELTRAYYYDSITYSREFDLCESLKLSLTLTLLSVYVAWVSSSQRAIMKSLPLISPFPHAHRTSFSSSSSSASHPTRYSELECK